MALICCEIKGAYIFQLSSPRTTGVVSAITLLIFGVFSEVCELCARIGRAKTKLAVLKEVAKERFFEAHPLTATQIKKYMRESYPLGLNHVSAALKFLESHGLVEVNGFTDKRDLKIYRITDLGRIIMHQIFGGSPHTLTCNGTEVNLVTKPAAL